MIKDYQILKERISRSIEASNLDIGAVYFILKVIMSGIENLYYIQVNSELMAETDEEQGEE